MGVEGLDLVDDGEDVEAVVWRLESCVVFLPTLGRHVPESTARGNAGSSAHAEWSA